MKLDKICYLNTNLVSIIWLISIQFFFDQTQHSHSLWNPVSKKDSFLSTLTHCLSLTSFREQKHSYWDTSCSSVPTAFKLLLPTFQSFLTLGTHRNFNFTSQWLEHTQLDICGCKAGWESSQNDKRNESVMISFKMNSGLGLWNDQSQCWSGKERIHRNNKEFFTIYIFFPKPQHSILSPFFRKIFNLINN